jgi:radical SAM superfamily enzyme YgiQ (UPF0313 family)
MNNLRDRLNEIIRYKIRALDIPLGISYISSSLKEAGYTTEMVYCTQYIYAKGIDNYFEKEPQIFVISIISEYDYKLGLKLVLTLKKKYRKLKIIIGGPYITLHHKKVFEEMEEIDALCIGAGEKAVVEYVKQVEQGQYQKTDNLWIKDNDGQIIKCDRVLSTENIDELPYPDRKGWEKWIYDKNIQSIVWTMGCVYNCIFCANNALRKCSNNNYFNKRSVECFVKELNYIIKEFKYISGLKIISESALANVDNFRKLCIELKKINDGLKKKISFTITLNFVYNLLDRDRDILLLMKEANIKWCSFSLESGSAEIRKKIGKPVHTNEQIIDFFKILRNSGIYTTCSVMYCYPFETKETYKETVECLKQCKPTFIGYSFMLPLEYTELRDMVGDIEYKDISFIHKYRANTFLLRVYITYKPIKTLLYSILRFLRNKYKILNKIINIVYKTDEIIKNIFIKINNKTEQKRQSFQERAKQEIDKGNFKEAIKYFNKVKIKEDNYWIYGDRAIAKMRIGDYKGAIKDFDKILELEPKEIFKEKREECLKKINKK